MTISFWTFLIPPIWLACVVAASIWYRRSKGKSVFPRLSSGVTFGETACSGRSLKGVLSRVGGAHNCLLVAVQNKRLVVTPQFPFNLMFLPEIYGLDLDVPIENVARITPITSFLRKALHIEFAHGAAPIELRVHDEDGFVRAIGRTVAIPGNRAFKTPQKTKKRRTLFSGRVFLAIWGTGGLIAAITGFQDDWRYRNEGVSIIATYSAPDQRLDGKSRMSVLTYKVAGIDYRLKSIYGSGAFNSGEQEEVYYLPADPQDARQRDYFRFNLFWFVLGAISLSISAFGGVLARRIW